MRVYLFPPPDVWTIGCIHFHSQCVCGCKGVSFFPTSREWTWGCIFPQPSVWTRRCMPFYRQHCGHEGVFLPTVNSVGMGVFSFPSPAVWTWSCIPFHSQQCGCKGVSLFIANIVGVRLYSCLQSTVWTWGEFLSSTSSVDVKVYGHAVRIHLQHHQCGRAGSIHLHCKLREHAMVFLCPTSAEQTCRVYPSPSSIGVQGVSFSTFMKCFKMPDCTATRMNKNTNTGIRVLVYQNEMLGAGMLMPVACPAMILQPK